MELTDYDFKDVPMLMDEISRQLDFRDGDVYVALVRDPGTSQNLIRIERMAASAYLTNYEDAREQIYDLMQALPIPVSDENRIRFRTLTVIVRKGLTVFGRHEYNWMDAWRYSNHRSGALSSDIALVTEHGWTEFMSGEAGYRPALLA